MSRILLVISATLICLPAWAQPKPSGPYQQGLAHQAGGRYQQALASYSNALRLNPRQVNAYINRATCRHQLRDFRGALVDLTRSIALDPASWIAYNNRGIVRQQLRQPAGAIVDYTQGISLSRKAWLLHLNRGSAHQQSGNLDSAGRDYKLALAGEQRFAEAYYNMATIAQLRGKLKAAAADFKTAIKHATPGQSKPVAGPDKPNPRIAALIKQLGATSWKTRNKATQALIKIGKPAIPQLKAALKSKDAEVRSRARQCLQAIQGSGRRPALQTHNTAATLKLARTALAAIKTNPGTAPRPITSRLIPADIELMRKFAGKK